MPTDLAISQYNLLVSLSDDMTPCHMEERQKWLLRHVKTHSRLRSLRIQETFVNDFGFERKPQKEKCVVRPRPKDPTRVSLRGLGPCRVCGLPRRSCARGISKIKKESAPLGPQPSVFAFRRMQGSMAVSWRIPNG